MRIKISHLPDEIVVDGHITLRAKSAAGFDKFVEVTISNREHISDWLPWAENAPNESSIEHYRDAPARKQKDETADWDIIFDGKMSGAIGIHNQEETDNLEIGYWLAKDFVGNGVMTQCVLALIDLLFRETDTPSVEISCDKANKRSAAVAIRCGLTLDREVDRTDREDKCRLETGIALFYRISREEWLARS